MNSATVSYRVERIRELWAQHLPEFYSSDPCAATFIGIRAKDESSQMVAK